VFLGSTAILNTLLGVLNERTYRRGSTNLAVPLRVCVGATNALPEDPALAAFADRFLARLFVAPVADGRLEELLETGWQQAGPEQAEPLMPAVDRLAAAARAVDMEAVIPMVAKAIRRLRGAGIVLTDRRVVRAQRLIAAATVLDGRSVATPSDLWVLPIVAPSADTQSLAREVLNDILTGASNTSLVYAAEEFSDGPQARARRLVEAGEKALATLAQPISPDDRLRVEATLREIDATLAEDDMPDPIRVVRERLIAAVTP
jgi:MoxR-like ATPase